MPKKGSKVRFAVLVVAVLFVASVSAPYTSELLAQIAGLGVPQQIRVADDEVSGASSVKTFFTKGAG